MSLRLRSTFVHREQAWSCELTAPLQSMSGRSGEMLWLNFSALLPSNKTRDWNCKPMSEYWILISNAGRRQIPRSQGTTLLYEDRFALWVEFFYLLVFKDDRLRDLHPSFLSTFCYE